jgi:hypothetical protein
MGKLLSEDLVQDDGRRPMGSGRASLLRPLKEERGGLWEGGDRLFGRVESENAVV